MVRDLLRPRYFREVATFALIALYITFLLLPSDFHYRISNEFLRTWKYDRSIRRGSDALAEAETVHAKQVTELFFDGLSTWAGRAYLVSCGVVVLMSTYYSSLVDDMHDPVMQHYIMLHEHQNQGDEHHVRRYVERVLRHNTTRLFTLLFWVVRLYYCKALIIDRPEEAMHYFVRHHINLLLAVFPSDLRSTFLQMFLTESITSFLEMSPTKYALAVHLPFEIWSRLLIGFFPYSWLIWMNWLPCAFCDDQVESMRIARIPEGNQPLARFQSDMCRSCWAEWSAGDVVVVLGCGHVFHKICNDDWLRISGRRRCPLCQFVMVGGSGEVIPARRYYSVQAIWDLQLELWFRRGELVP